VTAVRRVVLVLILFAAPVACGAVGYYLGTQSRAPEPSSNLVWIEQETRFSENSPSATVRCIYHRADGTAKVTENVVPLVTGAGVPKCPIAP
jgi:hypothetical protein